MNLFLALFNMIPAFPMDGGRVLRALLASRFGYVRATGIAASIGQFVAFALGFIGLMFNPILIFIAIFVYLAASSEAHMVALRAASRGVPVSYAMMTQFATLSPQAHIDEAVQTLLQTSQGEFPCRRWCRQTGRGARARRPDSCHQDARCGCARGRCHGGRTADHWPSRDAGECVQASAAEIGACGRRYGRAAASSSGLVTSETIAEMMMLQEALPRGVRIRALESRNRALNPGSCQGSATRLHLAPRVTILRRNSAASRAPGPAL